MINKRLLITIGFLLITSPLFAQSDVFYSVSAFGTGTLETGAGTVAISAGVATFSVAQTGNIGVGDHVISSNVDGYISVMTNSTTATIITAIGGVHGNVSAETLTSISHEYASFSAFEAGFTDASHINNTDLTSSGANVVAHACCYYDHDDQTADTTGTTINFGTTDSGGFLKIFTPQGGTESVNSQRHVGIWDTNKYIISDDTPISVSESYTVAEGLQVEVVQDSSFDIGLNISSATNVDFSSDIVDFTNPTGSNHKGINCSSSGDSGTVTNCPVYNSGSLQGNGIFVVNGTLTVINSTVNGFTDGIEADNGTLTVTNTAVFGNTDDFDIAGGASATITFCASDDEDGTDSQLLDSTSSYANEFTDITTFDYSLVSGGVCIDNGTNTGAPSEDVAGTSRPQNGTTDISAFEFEVAAAGIAIFRRRIK